MCLSVRVRVFFERASEQASEREREKASACSQGRGKRGGQGRGEGQGGIRSKHLTHRVSEYAIEALTVRPVQRSQILRLELEQMHAGTDHSDEPPSLGRVWGEMIG